MHPTAPLHNFIGTQTRYPCVSPSLRVCVHAAELQNGCSLRSALSSSAKSPWLDRFCSALYQIRAAFHKVLHILAANSKNAAVSDFPHLLFGRPGLQFATVILAHPTMQAAGEFHTV